MKTQTKWILGIGIIIMIALILIVPKLGLFSIAFTTSQPSCDTRYSQLAAQFPNGCVIPCIQMTSAVSSCIDNYYSGYFAEDINSWIIVYSARRCATMYSEQAVDGTDNGQRNLGLYNCVPSYKNYIDNNLLPQSQNCNLPADTNCDNVVSRTELGVIINSWIAGTASRSDLGNAIQSWVNG